MNSYLVFQLYAPLLSWGDISTGENRPSFDHPSKSALVGLLSAAVGISREDEIMLSRLAEEYSFSSLVLNQGEMLFDFHTAQMPPHKKRKGRYITRKDELQDGNDLHTVLSTRTYYGDAFYLVCVRAHGNEPVISLEGLQHALTHPKFGLYFGRKSCPAGMPLNPRIYKCESVEDVFAAYAPTIPSLLSRLIHPGPYRLFWEAVDEPMRPTHSYKRRDVPKNRLQWLFLSRIEHYKMMELPISPGW